MIEMLSGGRSESHEPHQNIRRNVIWQIGDYAVFMRAEGIRKQTIYIRFQKIAKDDFGI